MSNDSIACDDELSISDNFIQRVTFLPIIITIGIFLNSLNIAILKRQSSQHRSLFLLRALAVADISFLVVKFFREFLRQLLNVAVYGLAFQRLDEMENGPNERFFGFYMLYFPMVIFNRSTKLTRNWITVLIATERVFSLGFPLFAQAHITERRLYVCICIQYVLFACFAIGFMLNIGHSTYWFDVCTGIYIPLLTKRKLNPVEYAVYRTLSALTSAFTSLLPVLFLLILNTFLVFVLRNIGRIRVNLTQDPKYRNIDRKATKMTIAIVVMFLLLEPATSVRPYVNTIV
ncbi:uncharacterized protein LOC141910328 [Tubulanus polymorphus]|uniref:uncharacterized protein LOC141910328 n=1 Tax=Tubulanus polymorphus TaxID=672921 RepID=UPI003DA42F9E